MGLSNYLTHKKPELRKKLQIAKIDKSPEDYISDVLKKTFINSFILIIAIALFLNKDPNFVGIIIFASIIIIFFFYSTNSTSIIMFLFFLYPFTFGV